MAQLQEEWTKPIKRAIEVLESLYHQKIEQSIDVIVDSIQKSLSFVYVKNMKNNSVTKAEESEAKSKYQKQIINYETKQRKEIERIWNHRSIDKAEDALILEDIGLFSKESASIFGLGQKELIVTGASAGALGGLGIDLALGGGTLFLASLIGGAVGGVSAMMGFENLYDVKVLGRILGKRELSIGPMKNLNFPYILIGRSLYHASVIAKHSHAKRGSINLKDENSYTGQIIDSDIRKKLEKVHVKLREIDTPKNELIEEYRDVLLESFLKLLD
jgi:hypothetical protein